MTIIEIKSLLVNLAHLYDKPTKSYGRKVKRDRRTACARASCSARATRAAHSSAVYDGYSDSTYAAY